MSLPERLGRLRRVRRIGAGGFATVWLYRDDELRSDVAVKALADNWAQRLDVRDRFLEEARILRAADSDHVVRVHDIGESDGTPYFVMTYADRGSLDRALHPHVPLPPSTVLPLVDQAAAGLAVLHARGVVHRDVKPQNLLLHSTRDVHRSAGDGSPDGLSPEELDGSRLMVADLGVAKAVLHASGLTQVVGTPAYMAPEQVSGEGLDPRADVHALAAVTYQMLTGHLLRTGGLDSLLGGAPPVPPSALAPLPAAVDDVVLRAVHPSPAERWADVGSFGAALRAAFEDSPASYAVAHSAPVAQRPPAAHRPDSDPGRSRGGIGVALVVLVLLLSFAVSFGVVWATR